MAPAPLPPEGEPTPSISTLGLMLRLSGAGIIVSAGISLAWPFRAQLGIASAPQKAVSARTSGPATTRSEAVQVVFQAPGQTAPAIQVVQSPKRAPAPKGSSAAPAPGILPPAILSVEPPELPSQFTALEQFGQSSRRFPAGGAVSGSPPTEALREHRLVDGDTLQRLAQRYLGDSRRWLEIQGANAALLQDPDVLPIGKTLAIPPRTTARETPSAKALLKPLPIAEPGLPAESP